MKIAIETPTKAFILQSTPEEMRVLVSSLTYAHTGNAHLVKRHYDNHWYRSSNPQKWEAQLADLKSKLKFTLVFEENGRKYIRPGSIPYLASVINIEVENKVVYPEPKKMAWKKPLPFELYPYQDESWINFIKEKHGNANLCTSAGKSATILKACKELGLRIAIVVPSKGIFLEMLELFEFHFGKNKVGTFGNGSKKIGKQFTICICDSLVNVKPDTEEWNFFNSLDGLIIDESHILGSETLEDICHNVLSNIPYRFFLSGTQTRGDGTLMLLQSVIGKTVCTLTTKEAVEKGYICNHEYTIVEVESSEPNKDPKDPLESKRVHVLRNRNIAFFIAKYCNVVCKATGRQVLVLVEELDQIVMLSKLLTVPYVYAHSETKPARLAELGLQKVKTKESIDQFNRNDNASVIMATSVAHVGVNIYPTHTTFNWIAGTSEIKTKQAVVGRSVRKLSSSPYADKCVPKPKADIFDFLVKDVVLQKRHLAERISYYKESGTSIKFIKIS